MIEQKQQVAKKQMLQVTGLSIAVNVFLISAKLIVGLLSGSLAMIADAVHSLSDFATDIAVLAGIHFGSKAPDREHPYGHGKLETLAATFVASGLILVGATTIYYAAMGIVTGKVIEPGFALFAVAVSSIVSKEIVFQITKRIAIKWHSAVMYANAWHDRSDALSSVAVLVGLVSLKFGFRYGDQIAAIAVGLMVIWVGVGVLGDCLRELTEAAVDTATIEHIKKIINDNSQIRQWHKLRTRTVGREVFLDLHILVDPALSVAASHQISQNLESALHKKVSRPMNIIVHVEPDIPSMRKQQVAD